MGFFYVADKKNMCEDKVNTGVMEANGEARLRGSIADRSISSLLAWFGPGREEVRGQRSFC